MSWIPFFVVLVLAFGYMYFKRSGQVPAKDATEYLRNGAVIIDVRNPNEFESGHLMQAQNLPLDRIEMLATSVIKDKNKPLLLHCSRACVVQWLKRSSKISATRMSTTWDRMSVPARLSPDADRETSVQQP
jgi:hypothetical protein